MNNPGISTSKQRDQTIKRNNQKTKINLTTGIIPQIETPMPPRRGLSGHHTHNTILNVDQGDRRYLNLKI